MRERFYSIGHLSTGQLRDLYVQYAPKGWTDAAYYALMPEGITPPELSPEEIILNIDANHEHNYFVLMNDCENEQDGIMIGLGLTEYPSFAVYLHLPETLLDELVNKYQLKNYQEAKNYTIEEFLIEQTKDNSLN